MATATAPSPSLTPTTTGLAKVFRSRRGRKDLDTNGSSQSLVSSGATGDESSGGLRSSFDGAVDKLLDKASKSVDEMRGSGDSSKRLSKLLPGNKRRKEKEEDEANSRRNSAVTQWESGSSGSALNFSTNPSQDSLGQGRGGDDLLSAEDLVGDLTEDEDEPDRHHRNPVRPTLSPHESHAGYLTLSSPLIKTHSIDVATSEPKQISVEASSPHSALSSAVAAGAGGPDSANAATPADRNIPLEDRLRGAFNIPRKIVNRETGIDTDPVKSGGSVAPGTGGGFLETGRRGSINSRLRKVVSGKDNNSVPHEGGSNISQELPTTPQTLRVEHRLDTTGTPSTPSNRNLSPTTIVTPPTPTLDSHPFLQQDVPQQSPSTLQKTVLPDADIGAAQSPIRNGVTHRRVKSANPPPSKFSRVLAPPLLSPTAEETKTPGGTLTTPAGSGGFFSSVFSAAQQAANQFSNSINTSIATDKRPRSSSGANVSSSISEGGGEEVFVPGASLDETNTHEKRQLAVETLGTGELSLSHLGIVESANPSPMTSNIDLHDGASIVPQESEKTTKAEADAAARAVSAAYERPAAAPANQTTGSRPQSTINLSGDTSPPRPSFNDLETSVKRSGSVRSRISERRKRRHRGSSATTGGTIAAAIGASTATLTHPGSAASGPGHRLTGFAVASSKRNKDFHTLFRSVPEDDYLIEDYSAALQREILLHGRLYISEAHICFCSNILGWVTNLVIGFDEIVSVEKRNTAVIFPNAIVIATLHARNTFASLVARESTYDLLVGIWKISHPNLKSSLNGVVLEDASTGDKTEKAEALNSDEESEELDDEDEFYDEDEDEDDMGSFTEAGNGSIAGSDIGDAGKTVSRKASAAAVAGGASGATLPTKGLEGADVVVTGAALSADFPGPPLHAPTECGDEATHLATALTDTTIPAPLGKIYSLMFGPASGAFMRKWLVDDQKSKELVYEDDKKGLDETQKTFGYSFIKPLYGSIGPKQTKCIVTSTLQIFDLEKAVVVQQSTQTPDVPSGSVFTTQTRYCLMWGPGNTTRMIATCTVEWTGKTPIEKGANDGQILYVRDIIAALRAAVTTKPPVRGTARGKTKGKRRKETFDVAGTNAARVATDAAAERAKQDASWGLFEPLRGPFGPIFSLLKPLFTAQVIIVLLCILLAYTWYTKPKGAVGFPGPSSPERIAAYEEIWRQEESGLWDWLDERAGLEGAHAPLLEQRRDRQRDAAVRDMKRKLKDGRMSERQVDEAIRVTEERLGALKEAVQRRKGRGMGKD
ncbi:hypothetical protein LTR50_007727 [Elasticomyces elasticus]|nr:hypothetical protein LTR50_007727 [Elasticomyces elasticus]